MKNSITLKEILVEETKALFDITEKLFRRVADDELSWKPATGHNWMTLGQLLMHCANYGCGKAIRGFVKEEWDIPEEAAEIQHVPPATALPTVESVEQAVQLLAEDRKLTLHCLNEMEEGDLLTNRLVAPWGGRELFLYQHLSLMIAHLAQHKSQLFYYLKLMGKDVNSGDLWGALD